MAKLNITVIIPCKNERANIRPCIESARLIADEVLVADSGSTDGTLEIVRSIKGCRLVEREYVHSGDFKNWAIPQAACKWVFILDADERITPEMAAEIRDLLAQGAKYDGYWVNRDNYVMGHLVRYSGLGSADVLRLFRRDTGRYLGDTDHAEISLGGKPAGRLKSRLTHYTIWTYDQYLRKIDRYTQVQADVWYRQGKRPSLFKLVFTGPYRFVRSYVFQWGFLDGSAGFQVCMLHGIYSFLKQARLWELCCGLRQPDPEAPAAAVSSRGDGRPATSREVFREPAWRKPALQCHPAQ
jgi:glycosyltransferase involved in cell wall biosynthesis